VRRWLALLLALLAGALVAGSELRPPRPAPADSPADRFSAERAFGDVRLVAATPHPIGSAANQAVRERLRARMTALGLSPRLRRDDAVAVEPGGDLIGGSAETLIGVLPGRDPSLPPLALMAHYDSVPGAPGAADDGAGVAAALETVRAIRARGVPARDVAVILTDGEEAGLLGARGFFAGDPLAKKLGFVLNLEARGSGGRALMFETGRDDGAAIGLFRASAVRPLAGSLFGAVYARLPNDTDFSIARRAGGTGFNYAIVGQVFDYHAPTDAPPNLQAGSLQDIGEQVLSAAAAVAFAHDLPPRQPDVVYGALFGRTVVAYLPGLGWLVLGASAALIGVAVARARRLGPLPGGDVARGAGAALYAVAAAVAVLRLADLVAGSGELGGRRLLAAAGRWEAALFALSLGALLLAAGEAARGRRAPAVVLPLAAGLASCVATRSLDPVGLGAGAAAAALALILGARPVGRPGAWAGVLLVGLAAAAAVQAAVPLAAYVLAWPLALAALAAAATALSADAGRGRIALLALAAALGVAWIGVLAHLVASVVGQPVLLALPMLSAALVLWPLAQPDADARPGTLLGWPLLLVGAALVIDVRLANPWSQRHPRPSFVAYQLDENAGGAWRVTPPGLRTPWSDAALRAEGGDISRLAHWAWAERMLATPARPASLVPPAIALAREPGGLVTLVVKPPPGVRVLKLAFSPHSPARLVRAGEAAADAALPAGRWTRLRWAAPDPAGLRLTIRPAEAGGRLAIRYAAAFERWPPDVAAPAPAPPGVAPWGESGEALVTGSRTLTW
jgi:hypothetical protein